MRGNPGLTVRTCQPPSWAVSTGLPPQVLSNTSKAISVAECTARGSCTLQEPQESDLRMGCRRGAWGARAGWERLGGGHAGRCGGNCTCHTAQPRDAGKPLSSVLWWSFLSPPSRWLQCGPCSPVASAFRPATFTLFPEVQGPEQGQAEVSLQERSPAWGLPRQGQKLLPGR